MRSLHPPFANSAAVALAALALLSATGCRGKKTFDPPTKESPLVQLDPTYEVDPKLFIDGSNQYAFDLMQNNEVAAQEGPLLVSPPNLYVQALLLLNAASGETYNGIAQTIHLTIPDHTPVNDSANAWLNQSKSDPNLNFGNAMFMVWPFKLEDPFARRMAQTLDADIIKLGAAGLAAQQGIDDWSKQRTFGHLTALNRPLDREEDMMVGLMTAGFRAQTTTAPAQSATTENWSLTVYQLDPADYELLIITPLTPQTTPFPTPQELKTLTESLKEDPAAPLPPTLTPDPTTTDFTDFLRQSGMEEITDGPLDLRYMALELNGKYNVSQNIQTVELQIQGDTPPKEETRFLVRHKETGLILFFGKL